MLQGIRESNGTLYRKFGKVFGELGAIDPEQLQIVVEPQRHEELDDNQLAIVLINQYLVQAYRKAHTGKFVCFFSFVTSLGSAQDRAAYAIQEILKFLKCNKDTPNLGSKKNRTETQRR